MEILPLVFFFLIIVPSAILHEYAHGWMANQLGDPTAKYAGRLTLNPKVHIDRWGTILMPALLFLLTGGRFMFAYAKPVPFNPYNLRDQRWGPVAVALAGPGVNFILAFLFSLLLRLLPFGDFYFFVSIIVFANILLGVFNLVPIPPLDGSKLLFALLPGRAHQLMSVLEQYGFFVLIFFIMFGYWLISPVVNFIYELFTGGGGWMF